MPDPIEVNTLWGISLIITVAVLVVVVLILTIVLQTAKRIDETAREIWVVGKNAANCTVQLSLLKRTNQLVADILEAATAILHDAGRVARHAQTCPGCPRCVTEPPIAAPQPKPLGGAAE